MSDHIELPTDAELEQWEDLAKKYAHRDSSAFVTTMHGDAIVELARAVPRLLYLVRMERQDEAHRLEAGHE